jgi:NTP pyrophosphatase (non-canonical NTP hydrolase)
MTDAPDSPDLTAQLGKHRAEAQAEREADDFPFAGLADGQLRHLAVIAADLEPHLRAAAADNVPVLGLLDMAGDYTEDDPLVQAARSLWQTAQVAKLTEEAGEAMGAYLRFLGTSRRAGTENKYLAELADVVITAFVGAHIAGADLAAHIERKLRAIYARGWNE